MGLYFKAVRGPFVSASLLPVLYGTALARWYGLPISPLRLVFNLLGVVALHFGANAANDYFDYVSGADPDRPVKPFSGGSQLLQRGLLQPRHYGWLIGGHLALASVIALGFGFVAGPIAGRHFPWLLLQCTPGKTRLPGVGRIGGRLSLRPTVCGRLFCPVWQATH
mgnify:CR=1 FL=1